MVSSKFTYAVMTVFLIEFVLWLFSGETYSKTTLFGILTDPSTLATNPLYAVTITVLLGTFALASIVPGNLVQINYFALYAAVMVVFVTFIFSTVHLFVFIYGQLGSVGSPLQTAIPMLITGPILVMYLIAAMEWVRSNQ